MLKLFSGLFVLFLLLPGIASALMPPKDISKLNLEAEFILIGEVKETGKVLLPEQGKDARKGVFILRVIHVVKGYGKINTEENVHILYRLPIESKTGLAAQRTGSPHVNVNAGDLVVVYIHPSQFPDFYTPMAEGSSVIVIHSSQKEHIKDKGKKISE